MASMSSDSRLIQIRKLIKQNALTHILVSNPTDVEYITGFHSSRVFLLVESRRAILFSDFRYQQAALDFCAKNKPYRFEKIQQDAFASLSSFIPKKSVIGIQSNKFTLDEFDSLKKACRSCSYFKLKGQISDIFMVKLPHEIKAMQKAARIGDKAYGEFLNRVKLGMTEKEAAALLDNLCGQFGSEKQSFDTIVLFGARAALPHGKPSVKKLKKGDWILCDFGCVVDGYHSDMTRTAAVAPISDKQREIYDIVFHAQAKAVRGVKSGIEANVVDRYARDYIKEYGYGDTFGHGTGHGIGLYVHENPRVNHNSDTILETDMVFTIEPGIYLPDEGGVRIEDMVVVKDKNSKTLTKTPRELQVITPGGK